jgi:DNA-binding PadR family transcriptional regulator
MQKDLRTAWLLLLLSRGASYGYELRRELRVCATDLDPAVLYRSLRDMEQGGLISSRWMQSQAGPRRRVYDITWAGHDELERIGEKIRSARDAQTTFLQALEQPGRGGTPPLP